MQTTAEPAIPVVAVPAFPGQVVVEAAHTGIAAEAALRGSRALVVGPDENRSDLDRHLAGAVRRGRATPLEAEHARSWVTFTDDPTATGQADLVIVGADRAADLRLKPSAILAVADGEPSDRPRTVGVRFPAPNVAELESDETTSPDAVAALLAWLPRLGFQVVVRRTADAVDPGRLAA